MNQPLAQATGLPGLEGPPWSSSQSCPFLVGEGFQVQEGCVQLTPVTLPHLTPCSELPSASDYLSKQTACWTKPLLPALVRSHQGVNVAGRWPQIGLLAWDVQWLETIPLPLWDGTRNGKQRNRSAGQILYWNACAGPQNVGMTSWLGNLEGDGWAKVGGRKIPNLEWVSFYHQGVNSPLLPISDCLEDLIMKGQWKCSRVWFFLSI